MAGCRSEPRVKTQPRGRMAFVQRTNLRQLRDNLVKRVHDMEAQVESVVDTVAQEEAKQASACIEHLARKERLEELQHELRTMNDMIVEEYVSAIALRSERLDRFKLYRDVCKQQLDRMFPTWIRKLEQAHRIIREHGYNNATGWRGKLVKKLDECIQDLTQSYGDNLDIVLELRDIKFRVNSYTRDEITAIVRRMNMEAVELACSKDQRFNTVKTDLETTEQAIACLEASSGVAEVRHVSSRQFEVQEQVRCLKRELPEEQGGDGTAGAGAGTNRGVSQETIAREVDKMRFMGSSYTASRCRELLRQCAMGGDWERALRVYECMLRLRHTIDEPVFRRIIRCCKYAKPVRSDIAVEVLRELESRGIYVDTAWYNLVLDCCSKGRHWRRALMVFREMIAKQVLPNTHTYQVLVEVGEGARDEPTCVYDAMKFSGVPAFIAYSAARANARAGGTPFAV